MGHAIATFLTFGKVYRIKLNSDASGYTESGHNWWVGRVITAMVGYPFATAFSGLLLYLCVHETYKAAVWILLIMLIMAVVLWMRDLTSLIWTSSIIVLLIISLKFNINIEWVIGIGTRIVLLDSIRSSINILKISFRDPQNAGDATVLSALTFVPPQVWGIIFAASSIVIATYTVLTLSDNWTGIDYFAKVVNAYYLLTDLIL
ncbi:hypothetical protein D3C78_18930 [compost metagenome]